MEYEYGGATYRVDMQVVVVVFMVECLEQTMHLSQRTPIYCQHEHNPRSPLRRQEVLGTHILSICVRLSWKTGMVSSVTTF